LKADQAGHLPKEQRLQSRLPRGRNQTEAAAFLVTESSLNTQRDALLDDTSQNITQNFAAACSLRLTADSGRLVFNSPRPAISYSSEHSSKVASHYDAAVIAFPQSSYSPLFSPVHMLVAQHP
jgi:hypothetical protein